MLCMITISQPSSHTLEWFTRRDLLGDCMTLLSVVSPRERKQGNVLLTMLTSYEMPVCVYKTKLGKYIGKPRKFGPIFSALVR